MARQRNQLDVKSSGSGTSGSASQLQQLRAETGGGGGSKAKERPVSQFGMPSTASDICYFCGKRVYLMEKMSVNGIFFHRNCFKCSHCKMQLKVGGYALSKGEGGEKGKFFCMPHYRQLFLSNPEAINYKRVSNAPPPSSSSASGRAGTPVPPPPSSPTPPHHRLPYPRPHRHNFIRECHAYKCHAHKPSGPRREEGVDGQLF